MPVRPGLLAALCLLPACDPEPTAVEYAFNGLEQALARAVNLGMEGYNEAELGAIATRTAAGDLSGTLTVDGQVVPQRADGYEGFSIALVLVRYADDGDLDDLDAERVITATYETAEPAGLELRFQPEEEGKFLGEIDGAFLVAGDLEGTLTIALDLEGRVGPTSSNDGFLVQEGLTTVTGSAEMGEDRLDVLEAF